MRVAIYDRVEPQVPAELPVRLVATCRQRSAALLLAVTIPALLAAAASCLMLLLEAAAAPGARTILAQHPALGVEVLAAIGFGLYLLALPVRRLFQRMTSTRTVAIDAHTVSVTEGGYFRQGTWSAPLDSYMGVAHHLRASLSGTRHELILVHPEREKSVLLSLAPALAREEVARVASLLGHKEISSGELYRLRVRLPRLAPPSSRPSWRAGATPSPIAART
jgi:hypothetical protein